MSQIDRSRGSLDSLQTQSDHRKQCFQPPVLLPYPLPAHTSAICHIVTGSRRLGEAHDCEQEQQQVVNSHSWDSSQKNWGMARKYVGKSPVCFTLLMVRKSLWNLAAVKLFICPESTVLKNRGLAENIVSLLDDGLILQVAWTCSFFGRQLTYGFLSPHLVAFCLCKGFFAICCSDLIRVMQYP